MTLNAPPRFLPVKRPDSLPIVLIQELPETREGFRRYSVELLEEAETIFTAASWLRGFQAKPMPSGWVVTIWPASQPLPFGYRLLKSKAR